jgi:hypothetical protein
VAVTGKPGKKYCRYFYKSQCMRGASCWFIHDPNFKPTEKDF